MIFLRDLVYEILEQLLYMLHVILFVESTIRIVRIETDSAEQTAKAQIRLLLRSSLIRFYTVCHFI